MGVPYDEYNFGIPHGTKEMVAVLDGKITHPVCVYEDGVRVGCTWITKDAINEVHKAIQDRQPNLLRGKDQQMFKYEIPEELTRPEPVKWLVKKLHGMEEPNISEWDLGYNAALRAVEAIFVEPEEDFEEECKDLLMYPLRDDAKKIETLLREAYEQGKKSR